MIASQQVTSVLADRLGTGPGRWEQRVLDETPGLRRVMSCAFHGSPRTLPIRVVAKAYATAEGARTAEVMASVHAALAALPEPPVIAVPRPLFYDPDTRVLVQEVAAGRPYAELAMSGRGRTHLRAAGAAIATLHRLDVPLGPRRTLRDNLRELVHPHPAKLAERLPDIAARVAAILDALDERERELGATPVAPVHRDLHLRQLLRDGGRVWVLDWDLAAATDPALDLGNAVAYMSTKLPAPRAAACVDALLEGYAGDDRSAAISRRRLYEAFTYVRLACKRFRLREPDWRDRVNDMLTRAERALEA